MRRLKLGDDLNLEGRFLICFMSYGRWLVDRVIVTESGQYTLAPIFPFSRTVVENKAVLTKSLEELVLSNDCSCLYHCESPEEVDELLANIIFRRDPDEHAEIPKAG